MELPKYPHCAIICGQTGCGKTEFVLDLLEKEYRGVFKNIVIPSDAFSILLPDPCSELSSVERKSSHNA